MKITDNIFQIFILVLCLNLAIPIFAINSDSLRQLIENEHDVGKKAALYLDLSNVYKAVDLAESEKNAQKAFLFAEDLEDSKISGLIHAQLGDIAFLKDSLSKAEFHYQIAIPLLEEAEEIHRLIKVFLNLGNRFVEKGNYPEAMNYYLQGLSTSQENHDSTYLPNFYNNLGVVYINLSDHRKALEYYAKALPLFEKVNDTMNIAGATTNIGSIYIHFEEYQIARQYYEKGYEIFKSISLIGGQAHALFKLGLLDMKESKYDDALNKLFESKKLQEIKNVESTGSKSMFLAETNINIGIIYYLADDLSGSEEYLLIGFHAAKEGGQSGLISMASEYLSKLYKDKKQFEKSLSYHELYKKYSDSSFNEENIRKLTQLELQHQFDTRMRAADLERITEEQKQKRLLWIYITTIVGLFMVIIIVALLLKLEKKKKSAIELEHGLLVEKLDHTNKELTTYVMYLLKKNEFILTIIEKLKKARLDAKAENKKIIAELITELQSNTDTISWDEFEVRFQQVHTEFYLRLSQRYPDLSPNEIRLCAFFKLNMTTKEIAALTYQSLNSIKVARYRLRKKLQLEKDENLVAFLAQI